MDIILLRIYFKPGETQHRSFIVEGYDAYDDEGYNRNRTTSDG